MSPCTLIIQDGLWYMSERLLGCESVIRAIVYADMRHFNVLITACLDEDALSDS
jgi:hypothetical protein